MNIRDFVSATLTQIIDGVHDARSRYGGEEANDIAPSDVSTVSNKGNLQVVEFDVAVTTSDSDESKKGGGLRVYGIGVGAERRSSESEMTVSRIRFGVPIRLSEKQPIKRLCWMGAGEEDDPYDY